MQGRAETEHPAPPAAASRTAKASENSHSFDSDHEVQLSVDSDYDGIIINPAAFTHTSIALLDALRATTKPKIEIHISNIYAREEYRRKSLTSEAVNGLICGFGGNSYILGIEAMAKLIYN